MNTQKPAQTGMDFPHDLPRQTKRPAQQRLTPPKPTKADRKRMKQGEMK